MRLVISIAAVWLAGILSLGCDRGGKGQTSPNGQGGSNQETTTGQSSTSQGGATSTGSSAVGGGAGAAAEECGSTVVEQGFVDVAATDPAIRFVGRLDFADPNAPRMTFPATMVETNFEGDAIDLRLEETAPATGTGNAQFYEVRIDDEPAVKLATCPGQEVYPLARDLKPGMHRVRVSKRTEGSVGTSAFLGFRVREDTGLSLPPAPERRMEFVGDSITCGYGNELSTTDPDSYSFTSPNENALLAYGAVTASLLEADYVAVAASGRGMVRNYSGGGGLHGPDFYELTGPDANDATWDHTLYSPDVIVVNLGTNDFSIGLEGDAIIAMREEYRAAYSDFFEHLRDLHPEATLVAAVGPMISDSYPPGYQAWTSIRADVQEVVDGFVQSGDSKVLYFEFAPQSSPYGEDWHPTVARHRIMADALGAFIEEALGW